MMKKINLLVSMFLMFALFVCLVPVNANVYVGKQEGAASVYQLSETQYDEETGKVSYQKISYSKNPYITTTPTESDAAGGSVEVSNDAQYVFFPARYLNINEDTVVSFKFKNNGVERIYLHAEYSAGISEGGVDYNAGIKFVCVDMLGSAWNSSLSKSIDGYDVTTVIFGNYATEIHDFQLVGFRLYFDFGIEVTSAREFEVFGYEVHQEGAMPPFASDPKPTRVSKLTSNDVIINNNSFTVDMAATIKADIYDYTSEYYKLLVNFTLDNTAMITFKLDNETVVEKIYEAGNHEEVLNLTKDTYLSLEMVFLTSNTNVKINSIDFLTKPYVDSFSGSGFTIVEENGVSKVTYTYKNGWYSLKAPIRNYNKDYDTLRIKFELSKPVVVGVYIDDESVRSHWSYTEPLPEGENELILDISKYDIKSTSSLVIYLDPTISPEVGTDGAKTVIFTLIEFVNSQE